ncbi:hypothetical protein GCM10010531_15570 [Blastococcus jejuensis]|uniref:EamA domain-containing protein n=2 Tax=Blastococcus jejuensis TaxID=351224 RepID=A0ABP6P198_9ACTN
MKLRPAGSPRGAPAGHRPSAVLMVAVTATWGLCFVLIQWGLRDAPVLWFAALRSSVAGAALLAYGMARKRSSPRTPRDWGLVGALALTNAGLAFAAMFGGVAGLSTGVAAVLANAQPLLILLPAWWLYREPVSAPAAVAMVAGFFGLIVVAGPGDGGTGAVLSLVAAAAMTAGTLLARRAGHLDVVMVSAWHFLLGGVGLTLVAWAVDGTPRISWTARFLAALAVLALLGTAWAFLIWFREAQRSPLGTLTAWTFLTPVFGVGFGFVLLGERPGGWTLAGLGLVLIALGFVLRPPRAARPASLDRVREPAARPPFAP